MNLDAGVVWGVRARLPRAEGAAAAGATSSAASERTKKASCTQIFELTLTRSHTTYTVIIGTVRLLRKATVQVVGGASGATETNIYYKL